MMDKEKLIHDILDLVLRINGGTVKRKGKGHPTAFVSFSGHIASVDVQVYENGWDLNCKYPEKSFLFYLDSEFFEKDYLSQTLEGLRAYSFYLKFKRRKKDDLHN